MVYVTFVPVAIFLKAMVGWRLVIVLSAAVIFCSLIRSMAAVEAASLIFSLFHTTLTSPFSTMSIFGSKEESGIFLLRLTASLNYYYLLPILIKVSISLLSSIPLLHATYALLS